MAGKKRTLGKVVSLHKGIELIGSKSTISSRDADIFIYDWGVRVVSKKITKFGTKRAVRIYSSNILGVEEIPQTEDSKEDGLDE